jgi:hypothetical protein
VGEESGRTPFDRYRQLDPGPDFETYKVRRGHRHHTMQILD